MACLRGTRASERIDAPDRAALAEGCGAATEALREAGKAGSTYEGEAIPDCTHWYRARRIGAVCRRANAPGTGAARSTAAAASAGAIRSADRVSGAARLRGFDQAGVLRRHERPRSRRRHSDPAAAASRSGDTDIRTAQPAHLHR